MYVIAAMLHPPAGDEKPAADRYSHPKYSFELMEKALREAKGNPTGAAQFLKCHKATVYRWIAEHPELAAIAPEARLELADIAELHFWRLVQSGDPKAVWRALTTLRKDVYSTRLEHTGPKGGDIPVAAKAKHDIASLEKYRAAFLDWARDSLGGEVGQVRSDDTGKPVDSPPANP